MFRGMSGTSSCLSGASTSAVTATQKLSLSAASNCEIAGCTLSRTLLIGRCATGRETTCSGMIALEDRDNGGEVRTFSWTVIVGVGFRIVSLLLRIGVAGGLQLISCLVFGMIDIALLHTTI